MPRKLLWLLDGCSCSRLAAALVMAVAATDSPLFSMEYQLAEIQAARYTTAKPTKLPSKAAAPVTKKAQPQQEESRSRHTHSSKAQALSSPPPWRTHYFLMNVTFLKFLLWLVLLGLFVELEFGLPYFVLCFIGSMKEPVAVEKDRMEGESAYSVFNPGCEAIQGTLMAEQLERELQYPPLAER